MVSLTTQGIQVSVTTQFEGRFFSNQGPLYLFSYEVVIVNNSPEAVQLMGRNWLIYDTNDGPSEVSGEGVIGKQPVLLPGEKHEYQSGCHLRASIGAMKGRYRMKKYKTGQNFYVKVPTFQFFATSRLN